MYQSLSITYLTLTRQFSRLESIIVAEESKNMAKKALMQSRGAIFLNNSVGRTWLLGLAGQLIILY